jgi:hypothetical protein
MKNPRKVVAAMSAVGNTVEGVTLRPITASTLVILERLDSPLVRRAEPGQPVQLSDLDVLRVLYALTHPAGECFCLIDDGAYDRAAVEHGDTVPLPALPAIGAAINRLWEQALSTVIGAEKKTATPSPTSPSEDPTAGC